MEKKLEEIKSKNSDKETEEYSAFIKESVNDGSYFKDALNWYFFRYVTVICDRTLLIFGAIISGIVLYCLVVMMQSAFPLVIKEPVFIRAQDQSSNFPSLVDLKPKEGKPNFDPNVKTVDEAVAKYLLSTYVIDRESYNFSKAEIEDVNRKFNRIKNTSSDSEYRSFQIFMSKENPDSPIHNFGQNVAKSIQVESVRFITKEPKDFATKALRYIAGSIPTEAEVRFVATTTSVAENEEIKTQKDRYLAKINFNFDGVSKSEKNNSVIKFTANGYQLFKIK